MLDHQAVDVDIVPIHNETIVDWVRVVLQGLSECVVVRPEQQKVTRLLSKRDCHHSPPEPHIVADHIAGVDLHHGPCLWL